MDVFFERLWFYNVIPFYSSSSVCVCMYFVQYIESSL